MDFIYNETASGAVDGINKVYTVLYDISKIEEVHIGGAPYRNLTYDGNTITLADAIPVGGGSPSVDYFRETVSPVTPIGDVTLGDIIDDIYDKIGQQRTNNLMYKESQILTQINTGIKRLHNMRIYKDRILSYSFNNVEQLSIQRYSATGVDITEKDHVPASGLAMINGHTFEYTNYVDGVLGGTVGVVYDTNDAIAVGYKIPDGVKKVSEILIDGCPVEYWDNREYFPNYKYYTIINTSDGDKYIFLPITGDSKIITVKYTPDYTNYSDDTDVVNIEYDYFELLSYYALYKIFQLREDDRWQMMEKEYKELLKDYKSYKSRTVDGINNKIKSNVLTNV